MKKNATINQHFVPQAYQRFFTMPDDKNKAYAFRPGDKYGKLNVKSRGISRIGSKSLYYELNEEYQRYREIFVPINEIEDFGFPYEDKDIKRIIENFCDADLSEWTPLFELADLAWELKRRNPTIIDNPSLATSTGMLESFDQIMARVSDSLLQTIPISEYIEGYRQLKNKVAMLGALDNVGEELSREALLKPASGKIRLLNLRTLFSGPILKVTTSPEYPFLSNDNPGCTWKLGSGTHTTGFSDWMEYYFIASATTALVCFNKSSTSKYKNGHCYLVEADSEFVDSINLIVCDSAYQYVYGGSEDQVTRVRDAWCKLREMSK